MLAPWKSTRAGGADAVRCIVATVAGVELEFETSPGVFSPRAVDRGTLAMLSQVVLAPSDRVLDLGCGYGVVGVWAAKQIGEDRVVMLDSDTEAVRLARANAPRNGVPGVTIVQSTGFRDTRETGFDWILCNPPYHDDFSVPKEWIHKGFNRLERGGRMVFVTKRRTWYENKLVAIFGGTRVDEVDGYFVLTSEKRRSDYANARPAVRR
ncbi:MAG: methyltransferase [Deltaproteobacteria bacterium]|nr:methyltransferase [Deltaproteobacteria bacterium]